MAKQISETWIGCDWFPPAIAFVPNEASWDRICRHYEWTGEDAEFPLGQNRGFCQIMWAENGGAVILIFVSERADKEPIHVALGILSHECSHACDRFFQEINEADPSTEFRAFIMGGIFERACEAYMKRRGV